MMTEQHTSSTSSKQEDFITTEHPEEEEDHQLHNAFSGRWTREEEHYAEAMMDEFRAGSLSIPTGTKLRGFLAQKLRCLPKRVSKKYECSGYNGRQQYINRLSDISPEDLKRRGEKIETLRVQFELRRAEKERSKRGGRNTLKNSLAAVAPSAAAAGENSSCLDRAAAIASSNGKELLMGEQSVSGSLFAVEGVATLAAAERKPSPPPPAGRENSIPWATSILERSVRYSAPVDPPASNSLSFANDRAGLAPSPSRYHPSAGGAMLPSSLRLGQCDDTLTNAFLMRGGMDVGGMFHHLSSAAACGGAGTAASLHERLQTERMLMGHVSSSTTTALANSSIPANTSTLLPPFPVMGRSDENHLLRNEMVRRRMQESLMLSQIQREYNQQRTNLLLQEIQQQRRQQLERISAEETNKRGATHQYVLDVNSTSIGGFKQDPVGAYPIGASPWKRPRFT